MGLEGVEDGFEEVLDGGSVGEEDLGEGVGCVVSQVEGRGRHCVMAGVRGRSEAEIEKGFLERDEMEARGEELVG